MKKNIWNIELNSQILGTIKQKNQNLKVNVDDILSSKSLLNILPTFEASSLFKLKIFKKWDVIFDEWDIDSNLYIIKSWFVWIEKNINKETRESKQLARLSSWDFFGEWSLDKSNEPKEVSVKVMSNSEILAINSNDIEKFIKENPWVWYGLLKHIIIITNNRLLEANKIIASNYEIEKTINSIREITPRSIFNLIWKIKNIMSVEYILYFEKHQIMESFLTLKYDSREPNKMQEKVFERAWYFLNLDELFVECNIDPNDKIIINKLSIGSEVYGYLILIRKKHFFNESDKKTFSSVANSLSWVIKKLWTDKEVSDKKYIKDMKK